MPKMVLSKKFFNNFLNDSKKFLEVYKHAKQYCMVIGNTQECTGMITNSGKCLHVGRRSLHRSLNCVCNTYFSSWEVMVWLFIILLFLPFCMATKSFQDLSQLPTVFTTGKTTRPWASQVATRTVLPGAKNARPSPHSLPSPLRRTELQRAALRDEVTSPPGKEEAC